MTFVRTFALLFALAPAAFAQSDYTASPGLMPQGGLFLFYGNRGPLSYQPMTPKDLPKGAIFTEEVSGKSCQYGLSIPLSASIRPTSVSGSGGNGGYFKTLEAIRRAHPDLAGVFDVKIDIQNTTILGIYRRLCVEISARGFKLKSS